MVRKLAEIMRRDEPSEWAGLRRTLGEQPSRTGANLFILGSAVDGGQQPADVAWRSAQRFVFGIVPPAEREWVWDWIVRRHTPGAWRRKRRAYALHRNRAWHDRVYRFAEFISKHLDGDPRNIWRRVPDGVESIDHVRSVLHTMRFGPALSRMVVGALLDHGLVKGETAFKDDIHVRRGMQRLRLAPSARSLEVLGAGRRFFGRNSWKVDLTLYRLGQRGYTTRAEIERYFLERVVARRDEGVARLWRQRRAAWLTVVRTAREEAAQRLGNEGWVVGASSGKEYLGFTLAARRGRIGSEFTNGYLSVWGGVSVHVPEATVEIWTQVDFDIDGPVARSSVARDWLRREGYKSSYDDSDRWETHYKLLRSFAIGQRPERVLRGVSAALARASERLVRMLETRIR